MNPSLILFILFELPLVITSIQASFLPPAFIFYICLVLYCYIIMFVFKIKKKEIGITFKVGKRNYLIYFLFCLGMFIIINLNLAIFTGIFTLNPTFFSNIFLNFILFLLFAYGEELQCRVLLFNSLSHKIHIRLRCLIIASLFAFAHYGYNFIAVISALILGLFLQSIYLSSKNIVFPTLVHASWNTFVTMPLFAVTDAEPYFLIFSIIFIYVSWFFTKKYIIKDHFKENIEDSKIATNN